MTSDPASPPRVTVRFVFDEPFHGVETLTLHEDHHTSWRVDAAPGEPCGFSWSGDTDLFVALGIILAEVQEVRLAVPRITAHPTMRAVITKARLEYLRASEVAATCSLAVKGEASDALTGWLVRAAADLAKRIDVTAANSPGGPVGPDLALASVVDGLGKGGRKLAAGLRKPSQGPDPWMLWQPDASCTLPGLVMLARCGWHDVVKPRLERENRAHHRSVIEPVFKSQVITSHIRPNIRETPDGQRLLPGLMDGGLDCRIIPQTDPRLVKRIIAGLDKLGTLTGHRVLRWEIETGHRQFLDGLTRPGVDFRRIEVEGGYSEIAKLIGVTSGDDVKAIREIIAAQDATIFNFPWAHMGAGHDGRLLMCEEIGATRGRRARVNLILGTMLVPGYASALNNPSVSAASRKLVPVTDLPPLVGSPEKYGPQVSLSMMLVLYLRDHAIELHEKGMVRLRLIDLQRMARQVGLTDDPAFLADLWRRWQGEEVKGSDSSTPPFVKIDGDRFTLSDHHATARQAIVDAGAQEAAGRIRGKASQELRAKKQAGTLKRGR